MAVSERVNADEVLPPNPPSPLIFCGSVVVGKKNVSSKA